ncbi:MAG: hypothetical protein HHJ11_19045 [Phycicoccus sp.]|nr:hypothetical protein [Phycicoccus sp.]
MNKMDHEAPIGSQDRERDDDERRKKDRTACVVYGMPTELRDGWSGAQWWAFKNRPFIGERINGLTYSDDVPCDRPGLVRLVMSTRFGLPGGVLVEEPPHRVDPVSLAVIAECLAEVNSELRFGKYRTRSGPIVSTAKARADWTQLAGGSGRVAEHVQAPKDAVDLLISSESSAILVGRGDFSEPGLAGQVGGEISEFLRLGHGPQRDAAMARVSAAHLRSEGWSDARIRRYLELYGIHQPRRDGRRLGA